MEISEKIPNRYRSLLNALALRCLEVYGSRLISLAVFGSVARSTYTPGSDIDCFLVVRDLPRSRMRRAREFEKVEDLLAAEIAVLHKDGYTTALSPVFRTPEEAALFSPLYLDMTEEVILLHDRDSFLENRLAAVKARLEQLGSKRLWKGSRWYWLLKPDFKPGEVFEL